MNTPINISWLSESDVHSILTMEETMGAVENVFRLHGRKQTQMPTKLYLNFDPYGGDLRTMPAYVLGNPPSAGVKIVNSNANNPEKGLPAVAGLMVVNDPKTGMPMAVMAAGTLTGMRTGAAGGIAAKYLARKNSSIIGLVGCGRQARPQLEALKILFSISLVKVWGQTIDESKSFCTIAEKELSLRCTPQKHIEPTCDADIVVTTTPVTKPLVQASWIKPGTHINAIGADAPGKQELDPALLKKAHVYIDEWGQASHAGEINKEVKAGRFTQADYKGELGEVLCGKRPGRQNDEEITIFDSTGLAIQDVVVAQLVLDKANKLNKGQVLSYYG